MKRTASKLGTAAVILFFAGSADARDLTLEQALAAVEASSHPVAQADLMVEQAELQRGRVMALWAPTATVDGVYTFNDKQTEFSFPNVYAPLVPYLSAIGAGIPGLPDPSLLANATGDPMVIQYQHDPRLMATVSQALYQPHIRPLRRAARAGVAEANAGREQAIEELSRGVIQLYFGAVAYQRLTEVHERNLALAQLNLERARISLREEVGTAFEVNRAEILVSRAERDLSNTRASYEILLDSLAEVLNVEPDFEVIAPPELMPDANDGDSLAVALENRAEIDRLQAAIERNTEQRKDLGAALVPVLMARANMNVQRKTDFGGDAFRWNLQLIAHWDAFDGGAARASRRIVEQEILVLEAQQEEVRDEVAAELRQARMEIERLNRDVEQATRESEFAQRNVRVTEDAFAAGVASALDVESAQEQLRLSEIAVTSAQVQLQAQLYELRHLQGLELF